MCSGDDTSGPVGRPTVRVVVVDDSPAMVKSLTEFLGSLPNVALVGAAANGADAIELCGRLKPDLVLLDFAMPGMNGADAARSLRRQSPATRIVMISNYSPFLAEAGPWPEVEIVLDKLDLGHELPGLIDRLFPAQ